MLGSTSPFLRTLFHGVSLSYAKSGGCIGKAVQAAKQDKGEVVAAKLGESSKKINLQFSCSLPLHISLYQPCKEAFLGGLIKKTGGRGPFLPIQATASAGNIAPETEFHSRSYADFSGDSDGTRPKYSHFKKRRLNYL